MHATFPALTSHFPTEAAFHLPIAAVNVLSYQILRQNFNERDTSLHVKPAIRKFVSRSPIQCTEGNASSKLLEVYKQSMPLETDASTLGSENDAPTSSTADSKEFPPPDDFPPESRNSGKLNTGSHQLKADATSNIRSSATKVKGASSPSIAADVGPESFGPPSLLVFSGGTAFNGVVEDLKHFTTRVSHVLPVSDDGGSTAEIVRVLGGPAVGDIRSRCLRLSDESSHEALAVKRLLGHRLSMDSREAKMEWYSIVEGEHESWQGVSDPYKDTIRAFLVHFHTQILRHSSERFSFQNGSIGNFFFAGARTFFRSMDAAIFTYSSISAIPKDSLVLPAVSTNDRLVLGAELQNGEIIRGQNMISHPSIADLEQSGVRYVNKNMGACPPLPSPIKRVFYMSTEGTHLLQEVFPRVNPNVVKNLGKVDAIIYGMGSLYTSICPSLVLRGVGEAIAARHCPKVFLLNGTHDRETAGMAASDFILAVCNALNRTHGEDRASQLYYLPPTYVTVFLVPEGGQIPVDIEKLHSIGVTRVVTVPSEVAENGSVVFDSSKLIDTLGSVISSTPPAPSE